MATRVSGVGRRVYVFMRGLNSVIRSLPDIAWGLLAVAAVGSGGWPASLR
jgi:ABC-type phosphate/phosphonate transport system permease subunit